MNVLNRRRKHTGVLIGEDVLYGIRIGGYVEVLSEIKEGIEFSRIEHSQFVETFLFMDSQDFTHKEVVISVRSDICHPALKGDVGLFD